MVSNLKAETSTANSGYNSAGIFLDSPSSSSHYYVWNNSVYINQVTPATGTVRPGCWQDNGNGTMFASLRTSASRNSLG